jgi:hypothetical protein
MLYNSIVTNMVLMLFGNIKKKYISNGNHLGTTIKK